MSESELESLSAAGRPRRRGRGKLLFIMLVILVLIGVILYLLSLINSKKFFLAPEGGELVVKKGIWFPMGSERYAPADPVQAALYGPIELPEELKHAAPIIFEDLPSLNRELARHMTTLATKLIFSNDDALYQKGKGYLQRVSSLQGLDSNQLKEIHGLTADVDYIEAKMAYVGVERALEDALKKFKQAETYGTGRFADAGEWIKKIQVLLKVVRETKQAGYVMPEFIPGKVAPLQPTEAEPATPPDPKQANP